MPLPPQPRTGQGSDDAGQPRIRPRRGVGAYLAAYDVHQAQLYDQCAPSTGIVPFMALVEQVMTREPYASAKRVSWIVDNGSSHRGKKAINRLAQRFPNAVMVYTPVHASGPGAGPLPRPRPPDRVVAQSRPSGMRGERFSVLTLRTAKPSKNWQITIPPYVIGPHKFEHTKHISDPTVGNHAKRCGNVLSQCRFGHGGLR
jgi:hypothetical protein